MLRFGAGLLAVLGVLAWPLPPAIAKQPAAKAAPEPVPPLPERKDAKAAAAAPPADVWSPAEIAAAQSRCVAALKHLAAVYTYEAPIKQGDCGDPAPIRLSKLSNVTFEPAALINCGMVAPLNQWITRDLQPLARKQLGGRIVKIGVMSDYSCRTALGRVGKKLSQHAYVDALDIRGFQTEKGRNVAVLSGWGATERDLAKAKLIEEQKLALAEAAKAKAAETGGAAQSAERNKILRPSRLDGNDVVAAILPGGINQHQKAARLGGPADKTPGTEKSIKQSVAIAGTKPIKLSKAALAALSSPPDAAQAGFLRGAHAAACRIFGTTLGPEANEMHRNHFHVDMAERKIKKICD